MKMVALVLSLGVLSLTSLLADYQLTLIDKDGVETKQCIKSYSFSNNLESISRQNGLQKDVFSEEETLTNKVFEGKPVYRKILPLADFVVNHGERITKYSEPLSEDVEKVVGFSYTFIKDGIFYDTYSDYVRYEKGEHTFLGGWFLPLERKASFLAIQKHLLFTEPYKISEFKFIVEYIKTSDSISNSKNTFKSYLHYVPSSSENEEVITKNLESIGVQFLKNYTYDKNTDSCIENQ